MTENSLQWSISLTFGSFSYNGVLSCVHKSGVKNIQYNKLKTGKTYHKCYSSVKYKSILWAPSDKPQSLQG